MLIPELRHLIYEFSHITVKITKSGEFYKRLLYQNKFITPGRWLPITLSEEMRGTNPGHLLLFAHNEMCNSGLLIQNAWVAAELFFRRNDLHSLKRFDSEALTTILHENREKYLHFKRVMNEIVDYTFC